jgi:hypothetical protein
MSDFCWELTPKVLRVFFNQNSPYRKQGELCKLGLLLVLLTVRSVANFYVYVSKKSYTLIPYRLRDHNIQS